MKSLFELIVILVLFMGVTSCEKLDDNIGSAAKFKSFDGANCELMLSLSLEDEFRILDPKNIDNFDIVPSLDLDVIIEFEELQNATSACSFADPINLTKISEK